MAHRNWEVKVYVGGLRDDADKYDLEEAFQKYGRVKNVWVARKPPGFAFVEMEDTRDAEDAIRGLDGTRICGSRVKVEMSNGGKGKGGGGRSRSRSRDRGRDRRRSRSGTRSPPRRSRRSPSYKSMSRERDGSKDRSSRRDRKREVSRSRSRS